MIAMTRPRHRRDGRRAVTYDPAYLSECRRFHQDPNADDYSLWLAEMDADADEFDPAGWDFE